VRNGQVERGSKARVVRGGEVVHEGKFNLYFWGFGMV
jgi:hypothetical protein